VHRQKRLRAVEFRYLADALGNPSSGLGAKPNDIAYVFDEKMIG
jgi:hypothetical protein